MVALSHQQQHHHHHHHDRHHHQQQTPTIANQYSTAKIQQTNQKPKEGQTICVVIFSVHFYRRSFIGFFSGMLTHTWAEIRKSEEKNAE